jgi:hypothetical protein
MDDLAQYKGKLKGAIVISAEPSLLPPPDQPAPNPYLGQISANFCKRALRFFKNEGALATLTGSGKPDGLLNRTGMGGRNYDIATIPAAFVSSESYGMV